QNVTFTANVTDKNGQTIVGAPVSWTLTPSTAGLIDSSGKFTADAKALGPVVITVTPLGNTSIHANATVTIHPLVSASVNITAQPSANLEVLDTFQFTSAVKDQLGNPFVTNVTWSSSNTTVGTINSAGKFTATALGSTIITVKCDDNTSVTDTANVIVVAAVPRNITVSPAVYSLTATQNVTFTANVTDKNGQTIVGAPVSWTLTPSTAGVVDTNGKFTADAKAFGSALITVTPLGNTSIHANATVTINPLVPASVNITAKPSANLEVLDTFQFTSAVKDQLGNPFVTNVTWSSSNTTVGTIDSAGKFTATALGSTVITVKCDDNTSVTDTANVIVVAAVPRSITIDPTGTVVNSTESVSFNVTVKDKNGNVLPAEPINWTLSPVGAGNLTSSGTSGTFTAAKLIETDLYATITAQPAGNLTISANATVAVKGFRASAINLTNSTSTVEPGKTFQFTADVKDQFGNDFPEGKANLTWTSSNTAAGTISGTGLFTAGTPGTTTITAASGSVNSSVEVKVYKETAPVFDVGVNKTGDNTTITSGLNTTITTSGNTSTITDSVTGTLLYLTFNQT
ncbi:MAG: Ig-like domain-containing protein, partial [Methanocorpusculum sp.]|nr:Ig-like domain-containing protein [Methanocorpusculum sp.]